MENNQGAASELLIQVKAIKKPRFKSGSEIATKVNFVAVDVEENSTDEGEIVKLDIRVRKSSALTEQSN